MADGHRILSLLIFDLNLRRHFSALLLRHCSKTDHNLVPEQGIDLFKRVPFGLDIRPVSCEHFQFASLTPWGPSYLGTPKIEYDNVQRGKTDEDDIVFPLDVCQSCGRCFHVHQCREKRAGQGPSDPLRPDMRGKYLG